MSTVRRMDYKQFRKAFPTLLTRGEMNELYNINKTLLNKAVIDKKTRQTSLDELMEYYKGTQYDHLSTWKSTGPLDKTPVHKRKPRIIVPIAKHTCDSLASNLFGEGKAPAVVVEGVDNSEKTESIKDLIKSTDFFSHMQNVSRNMCITGACFLRFYAVSPGIVKCKVHPSNVCYPVFNHIGELDGIIIQYVYWDEMKSGEYWCKIQMGRDSDIYFNHPKYESSTAPEFQADYKVDHNLGFVQGVWFCNGDIDSHDYDGQSAIAHCLTLFREIDYTFSAVGDAILYNSMPHLALSNMDEDDLRLLQANSGSMTLFLGRDGKADFLETDIKCAFEGREYIRLVQNFIADLVGVPMENQEQKTRSATSGQALRLMLEGLVNIIKQIRRTITPQLIEAIAKLDVLFHGKPVAAGENISVGWYEVVSDTADDINKIAQAAQTLIVNRVISRETMTKHFSENFNVDNVPDERKRIESEAKEEDSRQVLEFQKGV